MSNPRTPRTRILGSALSLACAAALVIGVAAQVGMAKEGDAAKLRAEKSSPLELAQALDRIVESKLKEKEVRPAPRSDDNEFLRRVYLDVVGTVPTVEEVEAFLADKRGDKRARKVEELLASDAYASHWSVEWFKTTTGLSPASRNRRGGGQGARYISGKSGEKYLGWLEDQMAANRGYNAWVADLLTATGRSDEVGAVGFTARWSENTNNLASATAKTFLGTRIQCAQCHDHIYEEQWKQKDFRGMAAFFGNVRSQRAPEYREFQALRRQMQAEQQKRKDAAKGKPLNNLGEGGDGMGMDGEMDAPAAGKAKGEQGKGAYPGMQDMTPQEMRAALEKVRGSANVIVISEAPANPRAAENARRRLEQQLKRRPGGQGAERAKERLELAATAPKFWMASEVGDVAGIPRRMLLARWVTSSENELFARTVVNRYWGHFMGAGVVHPVDDFNSFNPASHPEILDLLAQDFVLNGFDLKRLIRTIVNTDTYQRTSRWTQKEEPDPQLFAKAPVRQLTTEQMYHSIVRATGVERRLDRGSRRNSQRIQQAIFSVFSFVFDDDEGVEEQDFQGSIPQGLFLMNGELMQRVVAANRGTMLNTLMRSERKDGDRVEYLYLALYGRSPAASEKTSAVRFVKDQGGDAAAYEDLMWAMLNSAEFMTNH